MKRLLTIILVAVATISIASAQQQELDVAKRERGVSIGASGAANLSMFVLGLPIPGINWGAGVFVNVPMSEKFSFQAEVQYDRVRATGRFYGGDGNSVIYRVHQYVSVPLLFQREYGKKHKMFFNFGPVLHFSLGSMYRDFYCSGGYTTQDFDRSKDAPVVVSLALGLGMKIPVAERVDLLWEARLSGSINSVWKGCDNWDNDHLLNLGLRFGVAYRL